MMERRTTCHGAKSHSGFVQYCWMIFVRKVKASGGRFFSISVVMAVCPGAFSLAVRLIACVTSIGGLGGLRVGS